jgi:single-stranded-DNA-specific exonuclease
MTQALGRPVQPDALLHLKDVNWELWRHLQSLAPFGIGHPKPLFWSRGITVEERRDLKGGHLALKLRQGDSERRAIAWRWDPSAVVPESCDVAYSISINRWQGEQRLQLELKAIRAHTEVVLIDRGARQYTARWTEESGLTLTNGDGKTLQAGIQQEKSLTSDDDLARDTRVVQLMEEACLGLGLRP